MDEMDYLPVCHDCKLALTHPQDERDAAKRATSRHEDRLGHSTGIRTTRSGNEGA